jgi:hypothetical protein
VPKKILLQGGPGQGKSTLTQMIAQIYRANILGRRGMEIPPKARLPIRIELRSFSEYLGKNPLNSVEQYLCGLVESESGGRPLSVNQLHGLLESTPAIIIFDGLDEVGFSGAREHIIGAIEDYVSRCEGALKVDAKVIVTTRPPAIVGFHDRLPGFSALTLAPMNGPTSSLYLKRWLDVQVGNEAEEKKRIRQAFRERRNDPHVEALSRNPMQLSVLLHFIRLKGEAFPEKRAELYKEYFEIVIDRDVEKSPELREKRELIETLHQFLAFRIHCLTETQKLDGTVAYGTLKNLLRSWLVAQENTRDKPEELFRLGEERLGLLVALRGEGEETYYGFEVQPTREYFAAAYVNEQGTRDATEAFIEMIRRPFWFEVAMFLAGLRRPNERADLVARLRELDDQEESGWRQDGRLASISLLNEGVLSFPSRVYVDTIEYALGFYDPSLVPLSRLDVLEERGLLFHIKNAKSERHTQRVRNLLKTDNVRFELIELSAQVLPREEVVEVLLTKPLTPFSVLQTALDAGIPLANVLQDERFWTNSPSGIANGMWLSGAWRHDPLVAEQRALLHGWLAKTASVGANGWGDARARPFRFTSPRTLPAPISGNRWAMYVLAEQVALATDVYASARNARRYLSDSATPLCVGLQPELADTIRDLCGFTRAVLESASTGEVQPTNVISFHSDLLIDVLNRATVSAWLCVDVLLRLVTSQLRTHQRNFSHRRRELAAIFGREPKLSKLWAVLESFHSHDYFGTPNSRRFLRIAGGSSRLGADAGPTMMRLEAGGKLVPIGTVVESAILNESPLPEDLEGAYKLPVELIVAMLRRHPDQALQILTAKCPVRFSYGPLRLPPPRSVTRLCENLLSETEDPHALHTLACILRSSRDGSLPADQSQMRKLLDTPPGRVLLHRKFNVVARRRNSSLEELKEVQLLASEILGGGTAMWHRGAVEVAAKFIIDTVPLQLAPLDTCSEQLGLGLD